MLCSPVSWGFFLVMVGAGESGPRKLDRQPTLMRSCSLAVPFLGASLVSYSPPTRICTGVLYTVGLREASLLLFFLWNEGIRFCMLGVRLLP
jgi:hypothetical protein